MTATDDQGVKREAMACLQGDALQQHCQAITCRCFNINSDILGAHYLFLYRYFGLRRFQHHTTAGGDPSI